MTTVKLSVSSVILVSVLSGCSQQQAGGSSQFGSQQLVGGTQVATPQKNSKTPKGQSSNDFYESEAHRKERLGLNKSGISQQQVESTTPKVMPAKNVYKPKAPKAKRVVSKKPRPTHSVTNTQKLPAAKPGQCFAKVKVPAKYITKSKRILIQKASARRVLVRAPQYRWINKKILVRKATYKTRVIPALYKTVAKRKMVKPAYNTWRKGHGAITRIDNMTGDIMCRVKIPAVYRTVKKRVLVRPVQRVRSYVPAIYKTIKQKHRVSSAIYKTVRRSAKYKTQNYRVKVGEVRYVWKSVLCRTNAPKQYNQTNRKKYKGSSIQHHSKNIVNKSIVRTNSANQYNQFGFDYQHYLTTNDSETAYYKIEENKTVTKKVKTKKVQVNKFDMSKILKNKGKSKAEKKQIIVYRIQKSLKAQGFNPGGLDGKMGAWTTAALKAFQSSRGLPVGVLNDSTFEALGMVRSKQIQLATAL